LVCKGEIGNLLGIYGLPDIHVDELAALLELPDRISQIASA
jgi:hypothetical protein